jgi:hypothetical protein
MIPNENVLNRIETLTYVINMLNTNKRVVVPRYIDGEYQAMKGIGGSPDENGKKTGDLLLRSIKTPNQFICINHLKEKNILQKDIWYDVQMYLKKVSNKNIYGCGNYLLYDFLHGSDLLSRLFKNTLLITGHSEICKEAFKSAFVDIFETPNKYASKKYETILDNLLNVDLEKYSTIVFACGQIGKILMSDIIDKCECNMFDIGSMLNALLYKYDKTLVDKWTMSWTNTENVEKHSNIFWDKIELEL